MKPFAQKIAVQDVEGKDARDITAEMPMIEGANFFSGEFHGMPGSTAFDTSAVTWDDMWKFLGAVPPGPLPQNARAICQADQLADRAIAFSPQQIRRTEDGFEVDWHRETTPKAEARGARSRYAVLLLPKGFLRNKFVTTYPEQEKREQAAKMTAAMADGLAAPVKKMTPPKFRRGG